MASEIATRWSSRKFAAAMVWQGVMTGLLWFEKLPTEAYVTVTWLILGGYFVGNVVQKYAER